MNGSHSSTPPNAALAALCFAALLGFPGLPGALEIVSVNWQGTGSGNDGSGGNPMISGDGRFIVFASRASDLVAVPDSNGVSDVFVRDRLAGTTVLVSATLDGGSTGNGSSGQLVMPSLHDPAISGDGRVVVFSSWASDLVVGDDNGESDVFARDLVTGVTELISVNHEGTGPGDDISSGHVAVSHDGRYVLFYSIAGDLVPPGTPQDLINLFLRDRASGSTELVNILPQGSPVLPGIAELSADGRRVVFAPSPDCFVRDLDAGTTVQIAAGSTDLPLHCRITEDASKVFFLTRAQLHPADTDEFRDNYYWDSTTGTVQPVALDPNGNLATGTVLTFSADGRYAFFTAGDILVPGDENGLADVVRYELATGVAELVSWNFAGTAGAGGGSAGAMLSASRDGRWVAWRSEANDLVPDDDNGAEDLFARDVDLGVTVRVSAPWGLGDASSDFPHLISAGGSAVIYVNDEELLPGDDNDGDDVFVGEAAELFRDGFESGGTGRWSAAAE